MSAICLITGWLMLLPVPGKSRASCAPTPSGQKQAVTFNEKG